MAVGGPPAATLFLQPPPSAIPLMTTAMQLLGGCHSQARALLPPAAGRLLNLEEG